jgi:hypothetical protein
MTNLSPAELDRLSKSQLIELAKRGIVRVMSDIPFTEIVTMPKSDLPEYQRVAHLAGVSIHVREAARKYNIPFQTISRWVQRGLIKRLGMHGQKVMIDEADIAYCAQVYHAKHGQGKWLFNPDGTPYIPKR